MLIDDFMPEAPFTERHAVHVQAPPERAWDAVRDLDVGDSPVVRVLFALRSVPARLTGSRSDRRALGTGIDALLRGGFVLLAEEPPRELVLGLVGRFWTPTGGIVTVEPAAFRAEARPGLAVAVWSFVVVPEHDGCRVVTETRVRCTDEAAHRSFARYWLVVRPFSGLIRRTMLRAVRRAAERPGGRSTPGSSGG